MMEFSAHLKTGLSCLGQRLTHPFSKLKASLTTNLIRLGFVSRLGFTSLLLHLLPLRLKLSDPCGAFSQILLAGLSFLLPLLTQSLLLVLPGSARGFQQARSALGALLPLGCPLLSQAHKADFLRKFWSTGTHLKPNHPRRLATLPHPEAQSYFRYIT